MIRQMLVFFATLFAFTAFGAPSRSGAHIATDGNEYLVVWNEETEDGVRSIHGAPLTRSGGRLTAPLRMAEGRVESLIWTGEHYLAFTHHASRIELLEIDRGGVVRTRRIVQRNSERDRITSAAMAIHGRMLLVLTNTSRDFVNLDNTAITLPSTGPFSREQAAAASSDAFFHAFTTDRGDTGFGSNTLQGRFIEFCCGRIPEAPPDGDTGSTAASDGTSFLLIRMKENQRLFAGILNQRSRFTAAAEQELDAPATLPRAAWHGSEYLLSFVSEGRLRFWRLSNQAVTIGSPMIGDRVAAGEAADVASGAAAWVREDGEVRVGFYDPLSLAAGAPFHTITDVTRIGRRRSVR